MANISSFINSFHTVDYDCCEDVLDDATPKPKKYTYKAYCDSDQCGIRKGFYILNPVEKHISKSVDNCPDCGNIVFWDKKEVI